MTQQPDNGGRLRSFAAEIMDASFAAMISGAAERGISPLQFGMMVIGQAMPCIRAGTDNNEAMLGRALTMAGSFYSRACGTPDQSAPLIDEAAVQRHVDELFSAISNQPHGVAAILNAMATRLVATSPQAVNEISDHLSSQAKGPSR